MFKKFKKWSLKKRLVVSIVSIVLLALIIFVIYANFKPEALPTYQLGEATRGDLQTTFDTQGIVSSDQTKALKAAAGVKVLTVNVAVGERVTPGQVLATFDVAGLNPQIAAYKSAADKAKASYDKAAAMNQNAHKRLSEISGESAELQKQIASLQKEIAAHEKAIVDYQPTPSLDEAEIKAVLEKLQNEGLTEAEIAEIKVALESNKGNFEAALKDNLATKKLELAKAETQLSSLETQKPIYEAQTDETMTDLYKSVMEQKIKERDAYLALVEELKKGWVAEKDGLVTEINIKAGETFTPNTENNAVDVSKLLSMASGNEDAAAVLSEIFSTTEGKDKGVGVGMVLESYGDFYVDFTVGKYDLQNLKVGQKATVASLGKTYEAEVTYVSATANAQAGFDISSIASSITGGSSASANSAPVKVKILEPDEKIVLGFDVDVQIDTEKLENIVKIPVEAVTTADGENCVFIYNKDKKTVELRTVTLGAGTDTEYEVLDGIELGEQVVLNPKTALEDGNKIDIKA